MSSRNWEEMRENGKQYKRDLLTVSRYSWDIGKNDASSSTSAIVQIFEVIKSCFFIIICPLKYFRLSPPRQKQATKPE